MSEADAKMDGKDYGVTEVASVVVVTDKESGQPVGLDLVMHESVKTSEEAVRVLQHLAGNTQQLGWCINVLQRHATTMSGEKEEAEAK